MNDRPSRAERQLAAWLEEGPTSGPDDVLVAAHARARATRQRPTWWLRLRGTTMESTWRARPLPGIGRLGLAILLTLLVAALLGAGLIVGSWLLSGPTTDLNTVPPAIPHGGEALIAYTSWNTKDSDLFVARADGTDVRHLRDDAMLDMSPAWSPDGGRIALLRGTEGHINVVVIGPDLMDEVTIATEVGCYPSPLGPIWSPDGRFVIYAVDRVEVSDECSDMTLDLFIAPADGSAPGRRLLAAGFTGYSSTPAWSKDGRMIAFRGGDEQVTNLYVAKVTDPAHPWDLVPEPALTNDGASRDPGSYWGPRFSPDGARIASTVWAPGGKTTSVVVTPIDGGPSWTMPGVQKLGSAAAEWIDDRHLVFVASNSNGGGVVGIREVGDDTADASVVQGMIAQLDTRLAISPDGTLVLGHEADPNNPGNLQIAPLDTSADTGVADVTSLKAVMWATSSWQPVVNPDNPAADAPKGAPAY